MTNGTEPPQDDAHTPGRRLSIAVGEGARSGLKTALWLLSIMLPVSFAVLLLRWTGALSLLGDLLSPLFRAVDLPGSSALVFLSSLFINLYSAIAVMGELALSLREVTLLAVMGLIAHNFLVEIAVLGTTGSPPARMIVLRLVAALAAGYVLSLLVPEELAQRSAAFGALAREGAGVTASSGFLDALGGWAVSSLLLVVRIALILLALMVGERLLQELGVVRWLGKRLGPLMKVFGLPEETAFLWVVSNTLGLAYGSGVLRREVTDGNLSRSHGDLLNHHIAISHSLLEDTLLFVALGVPALWLVVPRLVLAIAAVWERRAELALRSRQPPATPWGRRRGIRSAGYRRRRR
ncbi:MAG: transporter [Spirochaetota bacterium]